VGFLGFASWKRLLLGTGPLGIITMTELSFIMMFVLILIWVVDIYRHGDIYSKKILKIYNAFKYSNQIIMLIY